MPRAKTHPQENESEETPSVEKKTLETRTPKGMRDIVGADFFAYQGFYERAAEVALYYGFQPIETPILEREEVFSGIGEYTDIIEKEMYRLKTKGGDRLVLRPEGTAPIVRAYLETGLQSQPQPTLLYYYGPFFRHENPQRGRLRELRQFGLEVVGTEKSIADTLIIKLLLLILGEVGLTNLTVELNTLGDKECHVAYRKALVAYFRKFESKLSTHARELLKRNPIRLLDSKDPTVEPWKAEAPEAIDHLFGPAKQHFKEVLEYLESMQISYKINSRLVRGLDYYSRTVFEIFEDIPPAVEGEEKKANALASPASGPAPLALASGGRYDYLARTLGAKKNIAAVGGAIGVDRVLEVARAHIPPPRIVKKPRAFFIQLGFEAKLKSIPIIESLRQAKVPVKQSLSKDTLSVQLAMAERLGIPWVLILGQKEVIDNTIIIRNMDTRSQETVPISGLSDYIKHKIAR